MTHNLLRNWLHSRIPRKMQTQKTQIAKVVRISLIRKVVKRKIKMVTIKMKF